jgi:hypothetical protein
VLLGHHVETGETVNPKYGGKKVQPKVFALGGTNHRELACVPGSKEKLTYHSLGGRRKWIEEKGRPARFKEYVSFNAARCYPEYLIEYERIPKMCESRGEAPALVAASTSCSKHGDETYSEFYARQGRGLIDFPLCMPEGAGEERCRRKILENEERERLRQKSRAEQAQGCPEPEHRAGDVVEAQWKEPGDAGMYGAKVATVVTTSRSEAVYSIHYDDGRRWNTCPAHMVRPDSRRLVVEVENPRRRRKTLDGEDARTRPTAQQTLAFLNAASTNSRRLIRWNRDNKCSIGIGPEKAKKILAQRARKGKFREIEDVRCEGVSNAVIGALKAGDFSLPKY